MPNYDKDRLKASLWAKRLLAGEFGEWVILDSETTGLYGAVPIELCVLSKYGSSMLNTRIKPPIPIESEAKAIHGISEEDLKDSPTFADIYPRLKEVLENKLVVIYNADFDTRVLFNAVRLHKLPRIKFKSACVMKWYAQYYGEWSNYWGNYKWQKLPGDRSHTAYGDCRDTFKLIKYMAAHPEIEEEVAGVKHELFPPFQIGIKWEKWLEINIENLMKPSWRNRKRFYVRLPKFYRLTGEDASFSDDNTRADNILF